MSTSAESMKGVPKPMQGAGTAKGENPMQWRFTIEHLVLVLAALAVLVGPWTPSRDYINPESGIGYWLGIAGGSLMLVLLIYPLRKRQPGLRPIGSVRGWFRLHMILGIIGPGLVLYHSNFSLGATNSNIALACMVFVAGSGIIGRYLYSRIHNGLYGRRLDLEGLRVEAEALRESAGLTKLLPELIAMLDASEKRITRGSGMWRALRASVVERIERRRLHFYVSRALRTAAARKAVIAAHSSGLKTAALRYGTQRLAAARRVAEFEGCERLFALWHVMHIPLFVMMLIAGVVHVIAVHVY